MHIIETKRIKDALQQAYDKQRKHADSPMSEASIEARACIECFEFVLEHCIKQEAKIKTANGEK